MQLKSLVIKVYACWPRDQCPPLWGQVSGTCQSNLVYSAMALTKLTVAAYPKSKKNGLLAPVLGHGVLMCFSLGVVCSAPGPAWAGPGFGPGQTWVLGEQEQPSESK